MAAPVNQSGQQQQQQQPATNTPSQTNQNQQGANNGGNGGANQGGNNNPGNSGAQNGGQQGNNGGVNNQINTSTTPAYTPPTTSYTPQATQAQPQNPGSSTTRAFNIPNNMPSSSSLRPSTSVIAPSSSAHSSSSSSPSSSSSSARPSSSTVSSASSTPTFLANDGSGSGSTSKPMKGSTIGAIVGGVVGGLALLFVLWMCWRWRKERKNRVPPPPPRDMSYVSQSVARQRASMNGMRPGLDGGGASVHRASSYSTLLAARPSSMYQTGQPSPSAYYSSYPIATPSSGSHEPTTSPYMQPSAGPSYHTPMSEPSPPLSGENPGPIERSASADMGNITGQPEGSEDGITPLRRPNLIPLDSGVYREGSSSSVSGSSSGRSTRPKQKSSIDRLRHESSMPNIAGVGAGGPNAMGVSATTSRAPSPSEGEPSSRATSPNPSNYAPSYSHSSSFSHGIQPRQYISSSLSPHPRPYSTMSMNIMGPVNISGAPHQGRRMMLQMPELLSPTSPRSEESSDFGGELARRSFDVLGQGQINRDYRMSTASDFGPASPSSTLGRHQRLPSSQSTRYSTAQSHQNYRDSGQV